MKDLQKSPVEVQHGYHLEWNPPDPKNQKIKQGIIDSHKPGAEALAEFRSDGTVGQYFAE